MSAAHPPATGSGLPILGQLSPLARGSVLVTLAFSVVAIVLDFGLHANETLIFVVAAIAILGLAWVVGLSTERLGSLTGPQVGGILNATFGNIAELIISFFALQAGLYTVVKASLTGSIIGNLLLVLGLSVLLGGLRHGPQRFSARVAGSNAALLVVALIGLFVPAVFAFTTLGHEQGTITEESVLVSVALMVGYGLSLIYQFKNPSETLRDADRDRGPRRPGLDGANGDRRPHRHGRAAGRPVRDPRRRHRAVRRVVRAVVLLRRRRGHPDDRQPRRAHRLRPARAQGQDGVRDGGDLRVEPPGRALRRAGPGPDRSGARPAHGPGVHPARGRRGGGGGRRSARSSPSTASRTGSRAAC